MKSTTEKQLKMQKTLNDLHHDLKRYQNIHNLVNNNMSPFWDIMLNHYGLSAIDIPSNLKQYIGAFIAADTEVTEWDNYYAIQQHILINSCVEKMQMMVEKKVFNMDSDEMEEYMMTESANALETAIEAFRKNNLLRLRKIEKSKFMKELNIDKFINIRKLIGGDIDEQINT